MGGICSESFRLRIWWNKLVRAGGRKRKQTPMMAWYCQLRQRFQVFSKFFLLNAILAVSGTKMKCMGSAGFLVAPHKWGVGCEKEKEREG